MTINCLKSLIRRALKFPIFMFHFISLFFFHFMSLFVFISHIDKDSPYLGKRVYTIDYIPGVKSIEPKDLMPYLRQANESTLMHRLLHKSFEDVENVDFILCNAVEELESEAIWAIQQNQLCNRPNKFSIWVDFPQA